MKTVTRRYVRKKTGEVVEKTYTYNKGYGGKRNKKSLTIVGKRGIYKERLEALVNQFFDADDYETAFDLGAIAEQLEADVAKGEIGRVTAKSLISRAQQSKLAKMFINAGYTVEQAAAEVGVSVDTLLNEKNWDGSKFTTPTGIAWHFIFNYDRQSVWEVM